MEHRSYLLYITGSQTTTSGCSCIGSSIDRRLHSGNKKNENQKNWASHTGEAWRGLPRCTSGWVRRRVQPGSAPAPASPGLPRPLQRMFAWGPPANSNPSARPTKQMLICISSTLLASSSPLLLLAVAARKRNVLCQGSGGKGAADCVA